MKKSVYIKLGLFVLFSSIIILMLSNAIIVLAQEESSGGAELSGVGAEAQLVNQINTGAEKASDVYDKVSSKNMTSSEYLKMEWDNYISSNKYTAPIYNFLKKISIVFVILLGEPFSFSLTFFIMILLWIFLWGWFSSLLDMFSIFSKWICAIISLGLLLILARANLIRRFAEAIIWIILKPDAWWLRIILALIIALIIILAGRTAKQLAKAKREKKEKEEEEENREKLKQGAEIAEGIRKGATKK